MVLSSSSSQARDVVKLYDPYYHYPITSEYFQDVLGSIEPFSLILIKYNTYGSPEYPDVVMQRLAVLSNLEPDFENEIFLDRTLSSIIQYDSYLHDWNNDVFYKFNELPVILVQPIYNLIQLQEDYYFNAAEYEGEESLYIDSPLELGHKNMIELTIYFPNLTFNSDLEVYYLNKGWDPGEDPPTELIPLIDYLETVIIPELRNHPRIIE